MKPLLLILFALATTLPILALAASVPVLDTNGNPVIPGEKYHVLANTTFPRGEGGGLFMGRSDGSECPLTVLQDYLPSKGVAFKFTDQGLNPNPEQVIYTGTPLGVELAETTNPIDDPCSRPPNWKLFGKYVERYQYMGYVGIGNLEDHPYAMVTYNDCFQIEKYNFGYKLVFCYNNGATCLNVGRVDDTYGRRLVAYYEQFMPEMVPYQVVFQKMADDDGRSAA